MQVLEDRGEMGSRHGRVTFSVLLLQVRLTHSTNARVLLHHFGHARLELARVSTSIHPVSMSAASFYPPACAGSSGRVASPYPVLHGLILCCFVPSLCSYIVSSLFIASSPAASFHFMLHPLIPLLHIYVLHRLIPCCIPLLVHRFTLSHPSVALSEASL
eukprot:scaffold73003_cov20-Tisochrysis_lutea.AAC.3